MRSRLAAKLISRIEKVTLQTPIQLTVETRNFIFYTVGDTSGKLKETIFAASTIAANGCRGNAGGLDSMNCRARRATSGRFRARTYGTATLANKNRHAQREREREVAHRREVFSKSQFRQSCNTSLGTDMWIQVIISFRFVELCR